jgi:Ca-activated chloride channel family protein
MSWANPDLLALLLLAPLVWAIAFYGLRARARTLRALADDEVLAGLVPPVAGRARAWQAGLAGLIALCLGAAAAGPRLGFEWQQRSIEGVSIVVVLDVSRSMDAQDVSPSRLERARRELTDLVGLLRGDTVGLVVFAAGPYVRIPLTVDYDTFAWAVGDSSSDTIRAQGSALAGALEAAAGLLGHASGSGKAILLVSDGEGHDEDAALEAALAKVRDVGARIYTLGVGDTAGAPIPLAEGGFKKDAGGSVVLTRLDEDSLRRLASATGGAYVRSVASDEDVRALYLGEIRGKLDAEERGVRREKSWHERFQWPLGAALMLLSLSALLGYGGRRRVRRATVGRAAAFFLVLLLGMAPAAARAGAAEEGAAAFREGQWARAAELLGQARVDAPGDIGLSQMLGEALYRAGRYREAEQIFDSLAAQDPARKAIHTYNAGNAAYRGGRLKDAAARFRAAVAADPSLKAAQVNAAAVEKEIAARTQPPPPDDAQQGGGGDDGGQSGQAGGAEQQAGDPQAGEQGAGSEADAQAAGSEPGEGQPGGQSGQPGSEGSPGDQAAAQQGAGAEGEVPPESGSGEPAGEAVSGSDTNPNAGTRDAVTGEPAPDGQGAGEAGADSLSAEGEGADGEAAVSGGAGAGDLTAEQAARLVDAVEEGRPRVVVGGRDTEKDW